MLKDLPMFEHESIGVKQIQEAEYPAKHTEALRDERSSLTRPA